MEDFEDLSEKNDRGILKKVVKEGYSKLKPCPGDTVIVHYVGTYFGGDQHGVQFDSSRDRNELSIRISRTIIVIKAWDVGVATMKVGEICELIASPEYAYADGKTLKFEIELFDTEDAAGVDVTPDNSGKVRKSVLVKGRDVFTPTVGLPAEISFREGSSEGDFQDVSYIVGDPAEHSVPECIDLAVRRMNTGERCIVRLKKGSSKGDATDESSYEVFLKSFEKVIVFMRVMELANQIKTKANDFLKVIQKTLNEMMIAVHLNMALAYLKLGDAQNCTEKCKKVLESDSSNAKALFRLGQVRGNHEDAAVYFKRIVAHNPNNTAALNQLRICEEMVQKAKEKERKMYRRPFASVGDLYLCAMSWFDRHGASSSLARHVQRDHGKVVDGQTCNT
ncbi:unnamed protein product [Echinostoma caproni]|uniref:peptidylprolyl isomerase n=1 Tax=Echinostoma caproni TaxID=27848 RepID=A0A3P8GAI4_9TREM|nr:unnamed protein product [Echinostoma caproni]